MAETRDYQKASRDRLRRNVERVAQQMRSIAERVEHTLPLIDLAERNAAYTYSGVAREVTHEVISGVTNANLSNVVDAASDADLIRADLAREAAVAGRPDGQEILASVAEVARGWAETSHQNQVESGGRGGDVQSADEQPFVLADILRMINDAARENGLKPLGEEKA